MLFKSVSSSLKQEKNKTKATILPSVQENLIGVQAICECLKAEITIEKAAHSDIFAGYIDL